MLKDAAASDPKLTQQVAMALVEQLMSTDPQVSLSGVF